MGQESDDSGIDVSDIEKASWEEIEVLCVALIITITAANPLPQDLEMGRAASFRKYWKPRLYIL
jgi:hypothetical protein